jgi:hypothetical protein
MKKKKITPKKSQPCRRCGSPALRAYCPTCWRAFEQFMGEVGGRLFRLEWAEREVKEGST